MIEISINTRKKKDKNVQKTKSFFYSLLSFSKKSNSDSVGHGANWIREAYNCFFGNNQRHKAKAKNS